MSDLKPFIKYCGGKTRLLPYIIENLPTKEFKNYFEPFVGGGSVLFGLKSKDNQYNCNRTYTISDINESLMNCYETIKNNVNSLVNELSKDKYKNEQDSYYSARKRFNEIKFNEKMDYTDIAKEVSSQVLNSTASLGVLICGSGVGVSIVANKFKGIRAALCHSVQISELSRKHNNANVLCLGARIAEPDEQIKILEAFLKTEFEGGRHAARLQKIEI